MLFAFIVLYFFPTQTKQLFAWPIAPPTTAMFMGAFGYRAVYRRFSGEEW